MTTQTTFTYYINNDALDDYYVLLNDGLGVIHIVEYDCDGYPYNVHGTEPLPDYGQATYEELKAWACDELGWDPDDCALEEVVETVITESTILC